MAYVIQENTGANIFRILPETPYPTDHSNLVDLAQDEQRNNARPKIKDEIEIFSDYEMVFVGYPNWWGDMPMILYTFFDTYDFSGKTIIPFKHARRKRVVRHDFHDKKFGAECDGKRRKIYIEKQHSKCRAGDYRLG